jgi:hypothetical protein
MTARRPQPGEIAKLKTVFQAAVAKPLPHTTEAHEWAQQSDSHSRYFWMGMTSNEQRAKKKRDAARRNRKLRNKSK